MKDEFDDVTPDMFERGPDRKVSKISGESRVPGKMAGEEAAKAPTTRKDMFPKTTAAFEEMARSDAERAERRAAKGASSSLDEFNKKVAKPSGGGGAGIPKVGAKRTPEFKKGGKVSSASSRADGCAVKGKTKGRMV
jgi:hypothetical protein